jgi:hypothetical protein
MRNMLKQIASKMITKQFQRNKGILKVIVLNFSIVALSELYMLKRQCTEEIVKRDAKLNSEVFHGTALSVLNKSGMLSLSTRTLNEIKKNFHSVRCDGIRMH